jgi:hypothetical protein
MAAALPRAGELTAYQLETSCQALQANKGGLRGW